MEQYKGITKNKDAAKPDSAATSNIESYLTFLLKNRKSDASKNLKTPCCRFLQGQSKLLSETQESISRYNEPDQTIITMFWSIFNSASEEQKQLMLNGVLASSCPQQLSKLYGQLQGLIRVNFLSALPKEVAYRILFYLDAKSLCASAQVCRKWRELADHDVVWHRMCEQHIDRQCAKCGWAIPLLQRRSYRLMMNRRKNAKGKTSESTVQPPKKRHCVEDPEISNKIDSNNCKFTWKNIYAKRCKIERNWRSNIHKKHVLRRESGSNILCMQMDEDFVYGKEHPKSCQGVLVSGDTSGQVAIWCLSSGNLIHIINAHPNHAVTCLQFDECKLITGSTDKSVKVWNFRTGECLLQLDQSDEVLSLHFSKEYLAIGLLNCIVRLYNFATRNCHSLLGHTKAINAVKIACDSKVLYSASDDASVKVWCAKECSNILTFKPHGGPVESLVLLATSGSGPTPTDKQQTDREADTSSQVQKFLSSVKYKVITSSMDCTIKSWSQDMKYATTFFGHVDSVEKIDGDCLRILSLSRDGTIKLWNTALGTCMHTFPLSGSTKASTVCLSETRWAYGDCNGNIIIYDYTST